MTPLDQELAALAAMRQVLDFEPVPDRLFTPDEAKAILRASGWSAESASRVLSVSGRSVAGWIAGEHRPSGQTEERWFKLLAVLDRASAVRSNRLADGVQRLLARGRQVHAHACLRGSGGPPTPTGQSRHDALTRPLRPSTLTERASRSTRTSPSSPGPAGAFRLVRWSGSLRCLPPGFPADHRVTGWVQTWEPAPPRRCRAAGTISYVNPLSWLDRVGADRTEKGQVLYVLYVIIAVLVIVFLLKFLGVI